MRKIRVAACSKRLAAIIDTVPNVAVANDVCLKVIHLSI